MVLKDLKLGLELFIWEGKWRRILVREKGGKMHPFLFSLFFFFFFLQAAGWTWKMRLHLSTLKRTKIHDPRILKKN
jgi:hypothetical protein